MRVSDVMTRDVEALDAGSSLMEAAARMRDLDVGAIPVVRDGRPIGMLTDRDIAIRAVAEGQDVRAVTVGDLMTAEVVSVTESDSIEFAADAMQREQVRRLMVVDAGGALCGIVSLGDLSVRSDDDDLVEDTLEDVSWPGNPQEGNRLARYRGGRSTTTGGGAGGRGYAPDMIGGSPLATLAAGLMLGAGLMYILDPTGGRRRRAVTRQKLARVSRQAGGQLSRTARHARDKAQGVAAGARHMATSARADDDTLRGRVRAALGRVVTHPHSVRADVHDGVVTLRGPVLRAEVDGLVQTVRAVRGVYDVVNELEEHETPGNVPGLQGEGRAGRR